MVVTAGGAMTSPDSQEPQEPPPPPPSKTIETPPAPPSKAAAHTTKASSAATLALHAVRRCCRCWASVGTDTERMSTFSEVVHGPHDSERQETPLPAAVAANVTVTDTSSLVQHREDMHEFLSPTCMFRTCDVSALPIADSKHFQSPDGSERGGWETPGQASVLSDSVRPDCGAESDGFCSCDGSLVPADVCSTALSPQQVSILDTSPALSERSMPASLELGAAEPRPSSSRSASSRSGRSPSSSPSPRAPPFIVQEACAKQNPARNANRVSLYRWTEELLQAIVGGDGPGGSLSSSTSSDSSDAPIGSRPLFVVAGACPNQLCGMQALLFSQLDGGGVDFWWVKPKKDTPGQLERNTLHLHAAGPYKNNATRARRLYEPLAAKFAGAASEGRFCFGVDPCGRAYIEERGTGRHARRLLVYFVWQESWSSAWSAKKFMKGKLIYQRLTGRGKRLLGFFARPYEIQDGQLSIADASEEEPVRSIGEGALLPPDSLQETWVR